MKIYTKTGDTGDTSLFGGKRVGKDSLRIETYGTVDELNSVLGVCRSLNTHKEIDDILDEIQRSLFILGADLSTPYEVKTQSQSRIISSHISRLESHIDSIESTLTSLKNFILPGGTTVAAMLHFARTICRRAERLAVQLSQKESIGEQPIIYLNRLSDLLFVIARKANTISKTNEITWVP